MSEENYTEIIFWDSQNGVRKRFFEQFETEKEALKHATEWLHNQHNSTFIIGHRGVAVKCGKVSSITVETLNKQEITIN